MLKKMSVRVSEKIARSMAQDKVRKKEFIVDPRIRNFEKRLSENLGTRVQIAQGEKGGKITIDYFTNKDLDSIISWTKEITDWHEDFSPNKELARAMDLHNNFIGRELFLAI